jgi:hypothetical protein
MAILATQRVLTLDWWKYARHLAIGDYVFDRKGQVVRITRIQEYLAPTCYEVTFNDYLAMQGDEHLTFLTETEKYRSRLKTYKGKFKFRRPLKPFSVAQFLDLPLKDKRNRLAYSVPTTDPVQLPHQDLPVPPFIFGFWLFNKKPNGKMVFPLGKHDYLTQQFKDYGYKIHLGRKYPNGERQFTVTPTIESQLAPGIPSRITPNYGFASSQQRIELLSGILCAKARQYSLKNDTFRISSANYGTITQIQAVIESLGCRTLVRHKPQLTVYTIFFKSHHPLVPNQISKPVKVHHSRRYITNITEIPPQSCIHIETDGEDNTILVGEGFIPCR